MKKVLLVLVIILSVVLWDYFRSDVVPESVKSVVRVQILSGFLFPKYVVRDWRTKREYTISRYVYEHQFVFYLE